MISIKRRTLVVLLLVAAALGAGAVTWGTETADVGKPFRVLPAGMQARVIPAALPVPSGSFAQVAETVAPAVININTVTRGALGRTYHVSAGDQRTNRDVISGILRQLGRDRVGFAGVALAEPRSHALEDSDLILAVLAGAEELAVEVARDRNHAAAHADARFPLDQPRMIRRAACLPLRPGR